MQPRLRIGLTGGIASGNTTVSERFGELGVPVIDADVAARKVVEPGTPGLAKIIEHFGPGLLAADGSLDRAALRARVFKDRSARRELEAMLHPLIGAEMDQQAVNAVGPYLVLAIPLLIEGGKAKERVDRVLVVDVDEATQIERVMSRDASTADQARAILAAQAGRAARLAAADDVLVNSGTVSELRQAVDGLHVKYLQLAENRQSARN